MKPRSIISLIISAILILIGIITCAVASVQARSQDVMLFPEENEDGDLVYLTELDNITRLSITASDAEVVIIGGAERSTLEVINFNANYYKLSSSNGSLVFVEIDDILSMFKFWDNGFSFKGMRYIMRFGDDAAGTKRIVIRLSDEDAVRMVDVKTSGGNITVGDADYEAYYTLSTGTGSISVDNVCSAARISLSLDDSADLQINNSSGDTLAINSTFANVICEQCKFKSITADASKGALSFIDCDAETLIAASDAADVTLSPCSATNCKITTATGDLTLNFADGDRIFADVTTQSGKLSLNGKYADSYKTSSSDPDVRLTASTVSGNIIITAN